MIIFVAVTDINNVATTGADLNHLVLNILKSEFIMLYTITDELTSNTPVKRSSEGRFQRIKTFNTVDL